LGGFARNSRCRARTGRVLRTGTDPSGHVTYARSHTAFQQCGCEAPTEQLLLCPDSEQQRVSSRTPRSFGIQNHVHVRRQQRACHRGQAGGYFRGHARERNVRRDAREPVDEERRRDPEGTGRDQAVHHQPEGRGEVQQIRGHGPEPSLHPGEPQVNAAGVMGCCCCCCCCFWLLSEVYSQELHGTDSPNRFLLNY